MTIPVKTEGLVTSRDIDIENVNSDVVIGDTTANKEYLTSEGGDVTINVDNGNVYNSGVAKTLIVAKDGGNLNIHVNDGNIGKEIGPCADGVCTGIGKDARDLKLSVNANVDGVYTADTNQVNTNKDYVINMAALNSDMKVNRIKADGRVILLADAEKKAAKPYKILNAAEDDTLANVEGKGISMISSGGIGTKDKAVTFVQTAGDFNDNYHYDVTDPKHDQRILGYNYK